jgi:Fe-Mn family superoxide dismutase
MKFISHQVIYSTQLTSGQKALLEKLLSPKNGYEVSLEFQDLPYGESSLSKSIDEETMTLHHDKHHKKYFDNMTAILDENPELKKYSLIELLRDLDKIPKDSREKFKNNAGGHFNHEFYWNLMSPKPQLEPQGELETLIDNKYGSFTDFKKEFVQTALDLFGSGWVWLCYDNNGKLRLGPFPNQNNPHIEKCGIPLVGCDVWEHAYYLKYKNDREAYVNAWFDVVDWAFPEKILGEIK